MFAAVAVVAVGCSGGGDAAPAGADAAGTWSHPEEGTIVLSTDGMGTITQSGDPVEFSWVLESDSVEFDLDGDPETEADAVAVLDGDVLTFRVGDFSGDEPAVFTRD
jgi:hypothetical protein